MGDDADSDALGHLTNTWQWSEPGLIHVGLNDEQRFGQWLRLWFSVALWLSLSLSLVFGVRPRSVNFNTLWLSIHPFNTGSCLFVVVGASLGFACYSPQSLVLLFSTSTAAYRMWPNMEETTWVDW